MKNLNKIIMGLTGEFRNWVTNKLTGELGIKMNFSQGGVTKWYITTNRQGEQ